MGTQEIFLIFFKFNCILIFIWMICCIHYSVQADDSETMSKMKAVKDKLFLNYDRTIRPTNGTNTTEVYTAFIPRQIIGLDEERSLFSLDSYFFMHWYDPRLQWNTSDYDGYLQLSRDFLWVPDIFVYNSHSAQVDPFQEVLLAVHSSGSVYWFPPILTQTSCSSDSQTSYYPEDVVECKVVMGSWVHDGWEINFTHDTQLDMFEFENIHPRWELLVSKAHLVRNETYYECCDEPYISLNAYFPLKRRPVPEIEATRAPCILVMVLTLSIFWFPAESSKKLLLGGILFLVLNVLLCYVAWSTKNPMVVLYGVSFLQTAMYVVAITILLQIFVVIKIASFTGPSHPPALIVNFLTGSVGKYLLLRPSYEDKLPIDQLQLKEDSSTSDNLTARDEWQMLASALDRLLFFIMMLVMIAMHHL